MEKNPNNVPISEFLNSLRDPENPSELSAEMKNAAEGIGSLAGEAFQKHPISSALVVGILLGVVGMALFSKK